MKTVPAKVFTNFFRNDKGQIIIGQAPNVPLWAWIIFSVAAMIVVRGWVHNGLHLLAQASLFTWAYMEIRSGESLFRRALGAAAMVTIAVGFFR